MKKTNPLSFSAMAFRETTSFAALLMADQLSTDGEALYRSFVAKELRGARAGLEEVKARGGPEYPVNLSQQEVEEAEADGEAAAEGVRLMSEVRKRMREMWPDKGVVEHVEYEDAKMRLEEMKREIMGKFAKTDVEREEWEKTWPFNP